MTPEDTFRPSAAAGHVVIDELSDVGELIRVLVLAADHHRGAASRAMGVHVVELTALGHIWHAGQLTPHDLAIRLRISSPAVTALLDRLEQRGMVRRQPNPRDRRSLLVTLTPAAVAAYQGALAALGDATAAALEGLTETEVRTVRHFLRGVAASFVVEAT
jgi:DNA-binding MarR family transcriptional regulator